MNLDKMPFPGAVKLSERMKNLSFLFGELRSYAAEGCFKTLAEEVASLEATLQGIAEAKRFDRETFPDDGAFVDWAQSRARHALRLHQPEPGPRVEQKEKGERN